MSNPKHEHRVLIQGVLLKYKRGDEGYRFCTGSSATCQFSNWCQIEAEVYVEDEPRWPTLDLWASMMCSD